MTTPADSVTPVAKLPTSERQRAVLRAAQLYFLDGLTQAAVAERMGCTRWTVGRLLKEGEDSGVVDIRIRHAQARVRPLEIELKSRFGLADVQVVGTQETTGQTLALVAQTAADYLADIRPRPTAVALAWGRTTSAVARAAAPRWSPGTRVVQANAAPGGVDELLGSGATRLLARKAPGTVSLFDEVLENSLRGASPDISPAARRVVDEAESLTSSSSHPDLFLHHRSSSSRGSCPTWSLRNCGSAARGRTSSAGWLMRRLSRCQTGLRSAFPQCRCDH